MCTMWIDGLNGLAHHLAQNVDVAVVAAGPLPVLRDHARSRRWDNLRVLSAGENTFKYDLEARTRTATERDVSVFARTSEGEVSRFYTGPRTWPHDVGHEASICWLRCGTSSISSRRVAATGSRDLSMTGLTE